MTGACHCGAVSVTVAHKPPYVNFCDCSLCAKSGGLWGYYESAQVSVSGATRPYRRADRKKPVVEMHSCPDCSTTTHWRLTEHFEGERVGINMRLFDPAELAGIEARFLDGRNWNGSCEAQHRRPVGKLGVDAFL